MKMLHSGSEEIFLEKYTNRFSFFITNCVRHLTYIISNIPQFERDFLINLKNILTVAACWDKNAVIQQILIKCLCMV